MAGENEQSDLYLKTRKKGRLKIYLGFAPGVGKTYKMLREAVYLKNQHYDVVIGWLEDSTRADTLQFAGELEMVPAIEIPYRSSVFKELDVQGVVRRRPYLALIDELAHANIPGSLHEKRYQDIEYLLDHGINVMTTLNIQHVAGVREAAAGITGTAVTETVPDSVLDHADEVELIDVSSQVLQQRLKEGKIFPLEMVNRSTYGLFSVNKLLSLRELALRYVADEVDVRLEDYRQKKGINGVPVHERVLVCVNSPVTALRLIATGGKMARRMMGELLVFYCQVDSGMDDREEDFALEKPAEPTASTEVFWQLAQKYDGSFIIARVGDKSKIAYGINRVIREKKITQVVIGESGLSRWKEILQGSIITKIMAANSSVDIFVVGNRDGFLPPGGGRRLGLGTVPARVRKARGRLKIYIGAAAGVGKTVAMLREAHELKKKGIDIIIGVIETHNRRETAEYVAGIEAVPLEKVTYRDVAMMELNVQGIIDRRPKVVLIDELAHTNVPGSGNAKRYQDVEDILAAGIDVISAVNIQHIESLNDIVENVTKVKIRETVPDSFIAKANELVMLDLTPETLRARLKEGKIYADNKIEQALNSFFRKENLQALRELALREVAEDLEQGKRVGKAENKDLEYPENVLVCIQARGIDDRLIRRGFKIARRLKANFYVLHVIDGERYSLAETQQLDLLRELAEKLGAVFDIERVPKKRQIKNAMLKYVAEKEITKLVIGQSARTRLEEIKHGSIVNELLRKTSGIDILIIADPYRKDR